MDESLQAETARLERSWMRHDASMLRDYLVAGVEDPRLNIQSILSRHFLICALLGERYQELREHELRFGAVMNWVAHLRAQTDLETLASVLHGLRSGADNAEGIELPAFVRATWSALPTHAAELLIPNYLESALSECEPGAASIQAGLDLFLNLWRPVLAAQTAAPRLSVLEPACGSANDYRFLERCGLARLIDYTGFDLCERNITNARTLFPQVRFEVGNVFSIAADDRAYDLCFAQDLLEHLSIAGMETAVHELCRITRHSLCLGFFQMDEIPDHLVRPVDDYHWNLLSLPRVKALFLREGFAAQVVHIGSFLRHRFACEFTHNPNAYTLILGR